VGRVRGREGGREERRTRGVKPGPSSSLASRRVPGEREGSKRDHASLSAAAAAAAAAGAGAGEEEGREGGKRSSSLPSSRTSTCPLGPTLSGADAIGASTTKTFPPSLPPSFETGNVILKAINWPGWREEMEGEKREGRREGQPGRD